MIHVDESECAVTFNGNSFTAAGAYLDDSGGVVYVGDCDIRDHSHGMDLLRDRCGGKVTDWHGNVIGTYYVVSEYKGGKGERMAAIRVTTPHGQYHGRFGYRWSQACRIRRMK